MGSSAAIVLKKDISNFFQAGNFNVIQLPNLRTYKKLLGISEVGRILEANGLTLLPPCLVLLNGPLGFQFRLAPMTSSDVIMAKIKGVLNRRPHEKIGQRRVGFFESKTGET